MYLNTFLYNAEEVITCWLYVESLEKWNQDLDQRINQLVKCYRFALPLASHPRLFLYIEYHYVGSSFNDRCILHIDH